MTRRVVLAAIFATAFITFAPPVFGQYGQTLSTIASASELTESQALWLVGSVSGSLAFDVTVDEAEGQLATLGVVAGSARPDRTVTVGDIAFMLLRIQESGSDFGYGVSPSPYSAYRYLYLVGVIDPAFSADTVPTGAQAIDLCRAYLEFAAGNAEPATQRHASERSERGGRFTWDADVMIESSVALADLADIAAWDPVALGPDAMLTRDDLENAGTAYDPQMSTVNSADVSFVGGWGGDGASVELFASVLVRQASSGLWSPLSATILPGETGVRIVRAGRTWNAGTLSVKLGRTRVSDPSGYVVDQLVDGAAYSISWPHAYAAFTLGSTGLVDKFFFTPRETGDAAVYTTDDYAAPERLVGQVTVQTDAFAGQRIALFGDYYDDRIAGFSGERWYAGLSAYGAIYSTDTISLAHRTSVVGEFAIDRLPGVLALTSLEGSFGAFPLDVAVGGLYASGGEASFLPLTPIALGRVIAVPATDVIRASLDVSSDLGHADAAFVPSLHAAVFFTPTASSPWLGAEIYLGGDVKVLVDLTVRAEAGVANSPLGWDPYARLYGRLEL